jgi:hypothetical protein
VYSLNSHGLPDSVRIVAETLQIGSQYDHLSEVDDRANHRNVLWAIFKPHTMSNVQLNWHETTASFSEVCKMLNKSMVAETCHVADNDGVTIATISVE